MINTGRDIPLGTVFLVSEAARNLSSERGGCVAGCAFAAYGPALLMETKLMPETLAVFLTLGAVRLLWDRRIPRSALSGVCLGAACLLRPDLVLVIPLLAAWLLFRSGVSGADGRRRTFVWMCSVTLVIGAATLRNVVVSGEGILIASHGGVTFYQGNNPRAEGTFSLPEGFSGEKSRQHTEARAIAERETGHALSHAGTSRYWFQRGLRYWLDDPGTAVELLLRKLVYWVGSDEPSADYSLAAERCLLPESWLALTPFGVFLVAALQAVPRAPRRYLELAGPHLAFAVAGLVVGIVFYVSSRYRMCAAAHLAIFVGPAFDAAVGGGAAAWSNARRTAAALAVGLTLLPWSDAVKFQAASELRNLAVLRYREQNPDRALRLLLAARNTRPDNWEIRYSLGLVLGVLGDTRAAVAELEHALRLRPGSPETRSYLAEYRALLRSSRSVAQLPICTL